MIKLLIFSILPSCLPEDSGVCQVAIIELLFSAGFVAHAFNTGIWEAEAGRSEFEAKLVCVVPG